jgi:hypothetical protein
LGLEFPGDEFRDFAVYSRMINSTPDSLHHLRSPLL